MRVTAAQIEESVNKSLARLNTDYIDLLQVMPHPNGALPRFEHPLFAGVAIIVAQGWVRRTK